VLESGLKSSGEQQQSWSTKACTPFLINRSTRLASSNQKREESKKEEENDELTVKKELLICDKDTTERDKMRLHDVWP
jgi:hypothetical protein